MTRISSYYAEQAHAWRLMQACGMQVTAQRAELDASRGALAQAQADALRLAEEAAAAGERAAAAEADAARARGAARDRSEQARARRQTGRTGSSSRGHAGAYSFSITARALESARA